MSRAESPYRLTHGRKHELVIPRAVQPDLAEPRQEFRPAAGDDEGRAALGELPAQFVQRVQAGHVNGRNRNGIDNEPAERRTGAARRSQCSLLEVRGVEERERTAETV